MKIESIKRAIKLFFLVSLGVFAVGVLSVTVLISFVSLTLPDVSDIENLHLAESSTIYAANGEILDVRYGDENRVPVKFEEISPNVINATISIEDDQFWDHPGFDISGIVSAGLYETMGIGTKRGGSTITQQYVKYALLTLERSYIRKLKELILAVRLERYYDKNKIIELYLNKIPYGNNSFGVQKASETYFDKDAKDLDLAEGAILAAIIQAPSYFNPYGRNRFSSLNKEFTDAEVKARGIESESDLSAEEFNRGLIGKNLDLGNGKKVYVQGRTDLVLRRMLDLGYISEIERADASNKLQTLEFRERRDRRKYPHISDQVLLELETKYGKDLIEQGGLQIWTTIDTEVQDLAEKIVKEQAETNIKSYNANNAALVALNNKTGEVIAMVGSVDYYNEEIDGQVNMASPTTKVFRQPGSSFKPFVYAAAFYNGYAPASIIYDVSTSFGGSRRPKNYDGSFSGPITIRQALGKSRNIPAIKAYFLAGEKEGIMDLTQKMGLSYLNPELEFGWPLALGSGEVRLFDMARAYSVFANNGKKRETSLIKKITNSNGDVLEEFEPEKSPIEVLDPQIAFLINSILSDKSVNVGSRLNLASHTAAAKTGTATKPNPKNAEAPFPSNLWTVGYTTHITTAVWVGNTNDAKSGNMFRNADGYNAAAPIWQKFMNEVHKKLPNEQFPRPEGVVEMTVSAFNGKLPGPNTPSDMVRKDFFASFGIPTETDNSFEEIRVDIATGKRATPECPADFVENKKFTKHMAIDPTRKNWQDAIDAWAGQSGGIPAANEFECSEGKQPQISILSPSKGAAVPRGNTPVKISASAHFGIERVDYILNGQLIYTSTTAPFDGNLRISTFLADGSKQVLIAKVYDKVGLSSEAVLEFVISDSAQPNKPNEDSKVENETDSAQPKEEEPTETADSII